MGAPEDLLTQAGIYDKAKAPIKGNGAAPLPLIQSQLRRSSLPLKRRNTSSPEFYSAGLSMRSPAYPAPARRRLCCCWQRMLRSAVIFHQSMK